MPPSELTALLLLAASMSFSPGPNTALSTALAANQGLRCAMRFVAAVPVGWCVLLVLSTAGIGAAVLAAPALLWLIKATGIAYLLWMAWRLSGSARMASATGQSLRVGFWQGVGLQFVNIKAWLLALAIVAGWLAGREDMAARLAVVLPIMAAYAFFSNLLYACVGALLRGWLAQGRRLLWFNRAMAALLALTALWMAAA
ncbi:LysE family translocator [Delftia sp. PS-11]|uniref:LysE family translocator n=1 Tax=Delftia sp. PS-11 TaxID=2767222 RepID=UPI002458E5F8|nr:LysE family transporter [Delftia sp. PS-11]KAJ8746217.1 LysE family transporter [Delftia sp. PS-11]